MTLRVLITGSRDWSDRIAIHSALRKEWWRADSPPDAVLIHGGSQGADVIAAALWEESNLPVERHLPNYDLYGIAAPLLRNQEMVALGADVLLAFVMPCRKRDHRRWPPHSSHGSTNTIHLAKTAGIRTVIDRRVP
jgi:hypothetical protein